MTIKLNIQQANALRLVFEDLVIPEKPIHMDDKLLQLIMIKIYKKLRTRLEARLKGQGYSLALTDEEAIAYYLYFRDRGLGYSRLYEAAFINNHIGEIDKVYA
ncbi:hypothetical protein ACFS5N_16430 [Mucilaginibacter ximonensis]|uniref:Uncharacterized protein n=1 Tax=Mucilaginibacter ximonensis TaxID=538021 RepID=A0ABW5YFN6_9SPHI